ncbi:MAG: 4Fe-4S binding protein [Syntrophaceae bacterium]
MSFKQSLVAWVMRQKALLSPGHRAIEWPFFLGHIPVLREIHPWMDKRKSSITYLPINEGLAAEGMPTPPDIIADFIKRTPYRVIMNNCLCRTARDCQDYPLDLGCLFMGHSALALPERISRRVDAPEALRHLDRAVEAGLVPLVGKVRFDNFAFLIPDEKKLLSVCFCCPCCCMMAYYRHIPPLQLDTVFPRLEGLTIEVTDACQGCGTCAQHCYVKAIHVENGRAVHSATCRGCGRCARFCPHGAVRITLAKPDYHQEVLQRINAAVDIG